MRKHTLQIIDEGKVIAILRGIAPDDVLEVAQALFDGGIRAMELTFDRSGKIPEEVTCECIGRIAGMFEGRMAVGAGTVTTTKQVEMVHAVGGQFIVSPNTDVDVIRKTVELNMVSLPGALTPSEIMNAHNAGADYVKLFPATNMGTAYVKAIRSPISDIKLMAVGGINDENAADYVKAGCLGVGMGGNLVNAKCIANREFDKLTEMAKRIVAAVKGE